MGTGHCHCGAVGYEFEGKPVKASYCHCSLCRRLTGSAFGAYCEVPTQDLRWSGGDELARYNLTERYAVSFCRACGAPLATTHALWPGATYLLMGALEDDSGVTPQYHIFTGSKAPWYEIHDSLPQHDRWREEN